MSKDKKVTEHLTDEQKTELEKIVEELKKGTTLEQGEIKPPEQEKESQNQR